MVPEWSSSSLKLRWCNAFCYHPDDPGPENHAGGWGVGGGGGAGGNCTILKRDCNCGPGNPLPLKDSKELQKPI